MAIGALFHLFVVIYAKTIPDMFEDQVITQNSVGIFDNEKTVKSNHISKES